MFRKVEKMSMMESTIEIWESGLRDKGVFRWKVEKDGSK